MVPFGKCLRARHELGPVPLLCVGTGGPGHCSKIGKELKGSAAILMRDGRECVATREGLLELRVIIRITVRRIAVRINRMNLSD